MNSAWARALPQAMVGLAGLVGLWQLSLLVIAIAGRIRYGFDLEWMEGGVLHAAHRFGAGQSLYPAPSFDYIPFLYTPLYPMLLGALGKIIPLGFVLGRAVSVLSLLGLGVLLYCQTGAQPDGQKPPARLMRAALASLGMGTLAATYPYVDGWLDLVRADTLFLLLVTIGLAATARAQPARAALWLAAAFMCKQTGALYLAWAGLIILLHQWPHMQTRNWRAALRATGLYGVLGLSLTLGLAAWYAHATDGWFWTYIFSVHQSHDFNMDRFWRSFANIFGFAPGVTAAVWLGFGIAAYRVARGDRSPAATRALFWTSTYFVSVLVGAIGWGTQFAHYNAYLPAFLHAGFALTTVLTWWLSEGRVTPPRASRWLATGAALLVAGNLGLRHWNPRVWIPTAADHRAAAELRQRIAAVPGPVWVPSHPWLAHMAGKGLAVHRMGLIDLSTGRRDSIAGMEAARAGGLTLVLDQRDIQLEQGFVEQEYRPSARVTSPRTWAGARVRPEAMWQKADPIRQSAASVPIIDFEPPNWGQWNTHGAAFGARPQFKALAGQGLVVGMSGRGFATSMHGGDAATGRLLSPPIVVAGSTLHARVGGGTDPNLRIEVRLNDVVVALMPALASATEVFTDVNLDVSAWRGQTVRLVIVDEAVGSWGHINVDVLWFAP